MVEQTLAAALGIAYPHQVLLLNDGRLAGKQNWREIEALARRKGVRCLTRTEGRAGKAGNLNHGLRHSSGDFVGVIDADHRVDARFAHETLGYFDDPSVAFVTTPRCSTSPGRMSSTTWSRSSTGISSRPRTRRTQHSRAGTASSTGSSAGEWRLLGMELRETSTRRTGSRCGCSQASATRQLHGRNSPTTAAGLARQRLTWAIDSLRILFFDSPFSKRGLTLLQRLHYIYTTTVYLAGIAQLTFWIAPFVYLLLGFRRRAAPRQGRATP